MWKFRLLSTALLAGISLLSGCRFGVEDNRANLSLPTLSSASGQNIDFSLVDVNNRATIVVTLTNQGTQTATNLTLQITAPFGVQSSSCGNSLSQGASCSVTVAYKPTRRNNDTGTLTASFADERGNTVSSNNLVVNLKGAAQSTFTWVGGSALANPPVGTYGTKGTPDALNFPGVISGSPSWTDANGAFWLFTPDNTSRMMKFSQGIWEWVTGNATVFDPGNYGTRLMAAGTNVPPWRTGAATTVDASGNLWMFGGTGSSGGYQVPFSDLWKFDPQLQEWTWIAGPNTFNDTGNYGVIHTPNATNAIPARTDSVMQFDGQGNLLIFSGRLLNNQLFNDTWKYDLTNDVWTWISGSNTTGASASYGTIGVAAPTNIPGARCGAVSFRDSQGSLYVFGGWQTVYVSFLNDFWKFDGTNWTWISGSSSVNQVGAFGTKSIGTNLTTPAARANPSAVTLSDGSFCLYGGYGAATGGSGQAFYSDFWCWKNGIWTWLAGTNLTTFNSAYGTYTAMGQASSANSPAPRSNASIWLDKSGQVWLMGGFAIQSATSYGSMNDLWTLSQ